MSRIAGWRRVLGIAFLVLLVGILAAGGWGYHTWQTARRPPTTRLALDGFYPEMPPDDRHFYINLPLDHGNPAGGSFRGFYILSRSFSKNGPVVFFLTDGQMELVGTKPDLSFFDQEIPGLSYVLVGHRGHSPTLFPEVYRHGELDHGQAMRLYGADQRVEDIEFVRRDMMSRGLLPSDGRIMVFGASGAGVLAQEYLQRHGTFVSRVLLASTGAPDLAAVRGEDYARSLADYDPVAAREFAAALDDDSVDPTQLSYLLYQCGRRGGFGHTAQRKILAALLRHNTLPYWRAIAEPSLNDSVLRLAMGLPASVASRVRMFELLGADLRRQSWTRDPGAPLLYRWTAAMLQDFLTATPTRAVPPIDRSLFDGEVLVIAGKDDIVFTTAIGQAIAGAYPRGRFVAVRGGHRLEMDRSYQHALRLSCFNHGLQAKTTVQLLDAPPQ